MTDEQIVRARVLMAEQGIYADDLTDRQVVGLVRSLGRIFREERVEAIRSRFGEADARWLARCLEATLDWPRGDFEPSPVPPPPS